jgi:hypothetical protein
MWHNTVIGWQIGCQQKQNEVIKMKTFNNQTNTYKIFNLIDINGINWVGDFIGNTGALNDGQFNWDDELDAYICDNDTYDWWQNAIKKQQWITNTEQEIKQQITDNVKYDNFINNFIQCGDNDLEMSLMLQIDFLTNFATNNNLQIQEI